MIKEKFCCGDNHKTNYCPTCGKLLITPDEKLQEEIELLQAIRENQGKLISKFAKDNRLLMRENRELRQSCKEWQEAYSKTCQAEWNKYKL